MDKVENGKIVVYPLLGRLHRLKEDLNYSCDLNLEWVFTNDSKVEISARIGFIEEGEYKQRTIRLSEESITAWRNVIEKVKLCIEVWFIDNPFIEKDFTERVNNLKNHEPSKLRFESFVELIN